MNLLKKFIRDNNADMDEDEEYSELYMDDDVRMDMEEREEQPVATAAAAAAPVAPRTAEVQPERVALKLMQPKSHREVTRIADKLKEGCIVLLDISCLEKDHAHRLVNFLAGAVYVLGGEMIKTNRNTILLSPAGVDITGIAQDLGAEEQPAPAPAAARPAPQPRRTRRPEPAPEAEMSDGDYEELSETDGE